MPPMGSFSIYSFSVLLVISFICLQAKADSTGSVFFLESPTHHYLRPRSSSDPISETDSLDLKDVGAAVSVLLGIAPQITVSAASSLKLNEVLMPNPFDRPRTVFLLEISGVEDSLLLIDTKNNLFGSAFKSKFMFDESKADILLSDEVLVTSLNEPLSLDPEGELTEKELSDFASRFSGSYDTDISKPLNGKFNIPLESGGHLNLHMSKKADRDYIVGLFSLVSNIQKAIQLHQDLLATERNQAELIIGNFDGIKALQVEYGSSVTQLGIELFVTSISRMFDFLQGAYKGRIVGIVLNGTPPSDSKMMLNAIFNSPASPRWLEETEAPANLTAIVEVILVRRTVAWITGIMLIIATLLGIYFLLNMPLTRDTLLYSNVKLD